MTPDKKKFLSWLLLPLALLAIITAGVWAWDLDLACCRNLFQPSSTGGEWTWRNATIFHLLYHYGTLPGLLASLLALLALALSQFRPTWTKYRRISLYTLLLLAIGPGLVANAILKDHWGRPRPAMIDEFGGPYPFEKVLTMDPASPGKSFPCGHATMGFLFFGGFFIYYRQRRKLAQTYLFLGLILGGLIGAARMAQGGHFLSDVLWAAGIMWACAWLLALIMGLPARAFETPPPRLTKRPLWHIPLLTLTTLTVLFLFSLATPYSQQEQWHTRKKWGLAKQRRLVISAAGGDITINNGSSGLNITHQASGFGLPGSALKEKFSEATLAGRIQSANWKQRTSGLFSELEATTHITIGGTGTLTAELTVEKSGTLTITPPSAPSRQIWTIKAPHRKLILHIPAGQQGTQNGSTYQIGPRTQPDRFTLNLESGVASFQP